LRIQFHEKLSCGFEGEEEEEEEEEEDRHTQQWKENWRKHITT